MPITCETQDDDADRDGPEQRIPKFPNNTRKQVAEKTAQTKRILMTYTSGVYDMTEWIKSHPGGHMILEADGKDLGEFFDFYALHNGKRTLVILNKGHCAGNVSHDYLNSV